jgi:hypothetical protein
MENQVPQSPMRDAVLALRFISGKYQGNEFILGDTKEVVIGRSGDLDMVLVEDMVSRRHARITRDGHKLVIEDLGSTNGTFVNGEKIQRTALKEGDRVLIGTSILKIVMTDGSPPVAVQTRSEDPASSGRAAQTRTMSGSIEEIPLPDLLQLFGSSRKNGVLVVTSNHTVARIYLRTGQVYFAAIEGSPEVPPLKCVYRVLTWTRGTFDLEPPDEHPRQQEINASVHELLMEGLRQLDELNHIRDKLPDRSAQIGLARPLPGPLRTRSPKELDVLQLAHEHANFGAMLNQSSTTDLETATTILALLDAGYLRVIDDAHRL